MVITGTYWLHSNYLLGMEWSLHYIAQAGSMLSGKPILFNYLKDHLLYGIVRIIKHALSVECLH